jgi:Fe-Mn family superoxide dismutase
VYCAWGFEIGGDCAARLRERGIDAVAIEGGLGAWRADGLPTEPLPEGSLNEGEHA